MAETTRVSCVWVPIPVVIHAIVSGLLIGMIAANIWPVFVVTFFLLKLNVLTAAAAELLFLGVYVWWAAGGGPPRSLQVARAQNFRARPLSGAQWLWGMIAAVSFAATIHAALVVVFRFVPFPADAFHHGYDMSLIPSRQMQWLACVVAALSAGVCEETGFRGYMQTPIEKRHGPVIAILISSLVFMLIHLTKDWALAAMVPVVFGAGVLLGTLARASGTLVFVMIGHWIMDIGLFAYWWSQIAGTFAQRPVSETGVDGAFFVECAVFAAALALLLYASLRLRKLRDVYPSAPV